MDNILVLMALLILSDVVRSQSFRPTRLSNNYCGKPGLPCTIIEDPNCRLTLGADEHGPFPAFAQHIQVTSTTASPNKSIVPYASRSNVSITWDPPSPESRRLLRGFRVMLTYKHEAQYCFVFNVTGATWSMTSKAYEFELDLVLGWGGYDLEIVSLPENKAAPRALKPTAMLGITKKKFDTDPLECRSVEEMRRCWSTDIIMYYRPCNGTLNVSFATASSLLQLRSYRVGLLHNTTGIVPSDAEESINPEDWKKTVQVTLKVDTLPLKNRMVYIDPRDSVCDFNKCRVSNSQEIDLLKPSTDDCNHGNTHPGPTPASVQVQPVAQTDGLGNPGTLAAVVVGCLFFLALIVTAVVLVWRYYGDREWSCGDKCSRTHGDSAVIANPREYIRVSEDRSSNNGSISPPCIHVTGSTPFNMRNRPVIFIMYSKDHKTHTALVGKLAAFLQTFCSCEVIFDDGCGIGNNKKNWIRSSMRDAKYILLINSEGAYRKCMSYQDQVGNNSNWVNADLFYLAFEYLSENLDEHKSKLMMAHFPYPPSEQYECLPSGISRDDIVNYTLLDNVSSLFRRIHNTDAGHSWYSEGYHTLEDSTTARQEFTSFLQESYTYVQTPSPPQTFHLYSGNEHYPCASTRDEFGFPIIMPRTDDEVDNSTLNDFKLDQRQQSINDDSVAKDSYTTNYATNNFPQFLPHSSDHQDLFGYSDSKESHDGFI